MQYYSEAEKDFDPKENLLNVSFSPIWNPHTSLKTKKAHNILKSVEYALFLLFSDKDKYKTISEKILKTALKYQITDTSDTLYGYWQEFMEEPIKNQFRLHNFLNSQICTSLLQILINFSDFLNNSIIYEIKDACLRSIITFSSDYTCMNTTFILHHIYNALIAGEMFDKPDLINYSEQNLTSLYNRIECNNSFDEYNTINRFENIANLLSLLIKSTKNVVCFNISNKLNHMFWKELATHFHKQTMQISGPHANAENILQNEDFYTFLYYALDRKVNLPHKEYKFGVLAKCPAKYIPYFIGTKTEEYSQLHISGGLIFPHFRPSLTATSYIKKDYTLGTFNRELFWILRHPFIGYFGNSETDNTYCYKIDVLHDFYPYSSAALHCIQHFGNSMGHITFLTDRGDKHIDIDIHHGTVSLKDLRIRFSIFGNIDNLEITHLKNSIKIMYKKTKLFYSIPFAKFDDYDIKFRFIEENNAVYFDAIIYSGKEKIIDLNRLNVAIIEFIFLITSSDKTPLIPENKINEGFLNSDIVIDDNVLTLHTPVKPDIETTIFSRDKQMINNVLIEKYSIQNQANIENYVFTNKNRHSQQNNYTYPIFTDDNEFSDKIDNITGDFSNLHKNVNDILLKLSTSGFPFVLKKKIAVQIIFNMFECARNEDYRFNEVIDKKYSKIFVKIATTQEFSLITKHITKLCQSLINAKKNFENYYTDKNYNLIYNMLELTHQNLLNPDLSLHFVAEKMGYSVPHLSRVFLESTKTNYVNYIQNEKIKYAVYQLKNNKTTVKEVAEALGYSSPSSFSRMIKKVTGMTIKQYIQSTK